MDSILEKLQKLSADAQIAKKRTKEGQTLFDTVIKYCERVAVTSNRIARWPETGFIPGTRHLGRDVTYFDLPNMSFELYHRLIEAKLKVKLVYDEYTDYGAGAYGEDEIRGGIYMRIEW